MPNTRHSRALWSPRRKTNDRAAEVKRLYGITLQQRDRMLADQNGCCAVCGLPPTGIGRDTTLVIDHIHGTTPPQVRGLIHHDCNTALGLFHDDVELLKKAIRYLTSFKGVSGL